MKITFDIYTRKARQKPALLTILPIGLAVLSWKPDGIIGWNMIWVLIVISGGILLLSEVGRDLGKRKEKYLYEIWDGMPSVRMLRHRSVGNKNLLQHRHNALEKLIVDLKLPSIEKELLDTKMADSLYEYCSNYLKDNTRDKNIFPLIFNELCSYGFRRNLWGLKPLGVALSIIGLVAVLVIIVINFKNEIIIQPIVIISAMINFTLIFMWFFWFNTNWVKIAADAYAERLLDASERLIK